MTDGGGRREKKNWEVIFFCRMEKKKKKKKSSKLEKGECGACTIHKVRKRDGFRVFVCFGWLHDNRTQFSFLFFFDLSLQLFCQQDFSGFLREQAGFDCPACGPTRS